MEAEVRMRLETIHPNPGPGDVVDGERGEVGTLGTRGRRGRRAMAGTREGRMRRRRERVRVRRGERDREAGLLGREGMGQSGGSGVKWIATWNVQRLSMRINNRERLRRVVTKIEEEGWEIVLLSEILEERGGVIWLGNEDNRVVIVHSQKAAVVLRGEAVERWIEEGQKCWRGKRMVAVSLGGMRVVAVYQPVWGTFVEEREELRLEMEEQLEGARGERVIIGGDFNANWGKDRARAGVCGKYGVGRGSEAGRELVDWCEENGLVIVNSFRPHRNRGTWFHNRFRRWYELDGFLMRKEEWRGITGRMKVSGAGGLSDHKVKCVQVKKQLKRWRRAGRVERVPKVRWERLKLPEVKEEYRGKMRELMDGEGTMESEEGEWKRLSGLMLRAAEETCGVEERRVQNPWTVGHEEEIRQANSRIENAVDRRNRAREVMGARRRLRRREGRRGEQRWEEELNRAREEVTRERRELKRKLREWESEWWEVLIEECREACEMGRVGDMYKVMRALGKRGKKAAESHHITVEAFREHFARITEERFEEDPEVVEAAVEGARDLRGEPEAEEANDFLNMTPEPEEIVEAMGEVRESAPGIDGVRISYIKEAEGSVRERCVELVRKMFEEQAEQWDESLKVGGMVPLFKKGDREDRNNYRGVVLLAMASRILARVLAKRLAWWAERMGLVDENQAGFRKGRSTADVVQVMGRIQEDTTDCRRRVEAAGEEWVEADQPEARLLDLRKAYPRVNRPAMWGLLERYGLEGRFLESLRGLHESTRYRVKGREGMSEEWRPVRGLREGCATSPVLFNIYHQAVMRQAEEERVREGGEEVGIRWNWMPGSSFAGTGVWEKGSSEAKGVTITSALFADDTTIIGRKRELEGGVEKVKEVMGRWEERNNDDKEERLVFGTVEGGEVRVLGSWLGAEADRKNRIRRAGGLWGQVKGWLRGSRMSKKVQARVVEACVESSLLYDCQARVWYKKDVRALQSWVDKCYRWVWSGGRGQPLRRMQELGVNMIDVRKKLGVRALESKIEKRVLERVGHVMRMGDERLTKAVVLGWYGELEGRVKRTGRKRKTVLYWRRVLIEAGVDPMEVEKVTKDRTEWKKVVKERVEHIDLWVAQKGHEYQWRQGEERIERSQRRERGLICEYEGCGKRCKTKAGLTIHQKRMHREGDRVMFECARCGKEMKTEGARASHERTCTGGAVEGEEGGRKQCGRCRRWVSSSNYARHVRGCSEGDGVEGGAVGGGSRAYRGRGEAGSRRKACEVCGAVLTVRNMARHMDTQHRTWDPGGGPRS